MGAPFAYRRLGLWLAALVLALQAPASGAQRHADPAGALCGDSAVSAEARAAVADLLALADQDETAPDCPDCEGCFGGSLAKAWLTPASVDQAWTVGRSATFPARDHPAAPPTVRGPPLGGRAPPFVRPI